MTAEKATAQEATRKVAFAKVLAIQIIAYVVLVALALVPGMMYGDAAKPAAVPFTIIASLAMVVLLVVFSPFRDGVAGHVIAAIAGLLSAICATTVMLGNVIFPAGLDGGKSFSMEEAWIARRGRTADRADHRILRPADGPRKPHAPDSLAVAQRGRRRRHDRQRGLVLPAGAPADNAFQGRRHVRCLRSHGGHVQQRDHDMGRRRDRDGIGGRGAHRVLVLLAPRRRPRAGMRVRRGSASHCCRSC